jgi:hypothetical protein
MNSFVPASAFPCSNAGLVPVKDRTVTFVETSGLALYNKNLRDKRSRSASVGFISGRIGSKCLLVAASCPRRLYTHRLTLKAATAAKIIRTAWFRSPRFAGHAKADTIVQMLTRSETAPAMCTETSRYR